MNIKRAISSYIEDYGKMPGKTIIAEKTGLSRQTVHKHLKDYDSNPYYGEEIRKFRFMSDRVLSKMFRKAEEGSDDNKAARLYFEMVSALGNHSEQTTNYNTQNNFIQINQTKLSQETIKQLFPEQLNQIEEVLQSVSIINLESRKHLALEADKNNNGQ